MKPTTRVCPGCGEKKTFRADQKTCGCKGSGASEQSIISENTWDISLMDSKISSLNELVKAFKIDLTVWSVDRFVASRRVDAKKANHYQVKAFLRKRKDIVQILREIEDLKELAKGNAPK